MTLETTTNTGKNQKLSRKEREESVETIYTISVSLKFLYFEASGIYQYQNNVIIFQEEPKIRKYPIFF